MPPLEQVPYLAQVALNRLRQWVPADLSHRLEEASLEHWGIALSSHLQSQSWQSSSTMPTWHRDRWALVLCPQNAPEAALVCLLPASLIAQGIQQSTFNATNTPPEQHKEASINIPIALEPFEQGMLLYSLDRVLKHTQLAQEWRIQGLYPAHLLFAEWLKDQEVALMHTHLSHAESSTRFSIDIVVPRRSLNHFANADPPYQNQRQRNDHHKTADIPLQALVIAGFACLKTDELAALEPGDVILLEQTLSTEQTPGDVRDAAALIVVGEPSIAWHVEIPQEQPSTLVIDSPLPPLDEHLHRLLSPSPRARLIMTTPTKPNTAGVSTAHPLGQTYVEMYVEVTRTHLSLDELSQLKAGDVIALSSPATHQVSLRTAHQRLATGTLVDVEGELGIRIDALTLPDTPDEDSA